MFGVRPIIFNHKCNIGWESWYSNQDISMVNDIPSEAQLKIKSISLAYAFFTQT